MNYATLRALWMYALRPPRQIFPDRGLADIDTELEQFATDVRCAPESVGNAYPADQVADFESRQNRDHAPTVWRWCRKFFNLSTVHSFEQRQLLERTYA